MKFLKKWLEAFYMPCEVTILPKLYEDVLSKNKNVYKRQNKFGANQYNAIDILNAVVGPI